MVEECKMVMVSLTTKESKIPLAIAITAAPSEEEAEKHARKELEPFNKPGLIFQTKDLGPIMYPSFPTTIFLYVQGTGWLK